MLEVTDTTYQEILNLTNVKIANAVKLVTKEKDYEMEDYINRIEQNEIAKMVKLADRLHNLLEAHFASEKWINKYILETEKWYLKLSIGTPFEEELIDILKQLKQHLLM